MSQAGRSRSAQRASWRGGRGGSATGSPPSASRWILPVFWLGLVCGLGWLLWDFVRPKPMLRIACLSVGDYDVLKAPPLPYTKEGLDRFAALANARTKVVQFDYEEARATGAVLDDALRTLVSSNPNDVLIVYFRGYGVSENGEAWLLASDFDPTAKTGRYPVRDLLHQMQAIPASLRLLLLDTGGLDADPRFGLVLNEFHTLLAQTVEELSQPDSIWVMTSHGAHQRSHLTHSQRGTVFSYFISTGLAGAADDPSAPDKVLSLGELFQFVRTKVSSWVWKSTEEWQEPVLMAAGRKSDEARPTSDLPSWPIPSSRGRTAEASFTPRVHGNLALAGNPLNKAKQNKSKVDSVSKKIKSEKDAKSKTTQGKSGDKKSAKGSEKSKASSKSDSDPRLANWLAMQSLQTRSADEAWIPVDYAPHLWREYLQLVQDDDLRLRMRGSSKPGTVKLLEQQTRRMLDRRGVFLGGESRRSYELQPAIGRAIQERNESLLRAPSLVRWFARASPNLPSSSALAAGLQEWLSRLHELTVFLDATEAVDAEVFIEGLAQKTSAVAKSREAVWEQVSDEVDEITGSQRLAERVYRLEHLLSLPLLSVQQRAKLLKKLPDAEPDLQFDEVEVQHFDEERFWEHLGQWAQLEWDVTKLIDPELDSTANRDLDKFLSSAKKNDGQLRFEAYRSFGLALARFYRLLPKEIMDRLPTSSDQFVVAHDVESRLRLLDPRDAARLDRDLSRAIQDGPALDPVTSVAMRNLGWEEPVAILISDDNQEQRREACSVDVDADLEYTWKLSRGKALSLQGSFWLVYSPTDLLVTDMEGKAVEPRSERPLDLSVKKPQQVARFKVRAAREAASDADAAATITLAYKVTGAADLEGEARVTTFLLPRRGELKLTVSGAKGTYRESPGKKGRRVLLTPFPKGETDYQLIVENPTHRKRSVEYRIMALPSRDARERRLWDWPWDAAGEMPAKSFELASGKLVFEAGMASLAIPSPFDAPPAAPAANAQGDGKEAPMPPAAANETAPVDAKMIFEDGLVCMVRDTAGGSAERAWILIRPRHPRDYLLQEPLCSYDPEDERIKLKVRLADPTLLPQTGSVTKLSLEQGHTSDDGIPSKLLHTALFGTATTSDPSADLFVHVVSGEKKHVLVALDVDDYPRTYVFRVDCSPAPDNAKWLANYSNLQIVEPIAGTVLKGDEPLRIVLRADAPTVGSFDSPYQVKVFLKHAEGESEVHYFRGDRLSTTNILKSDQPGTYRISVRTEDLNLSVPLAGLENNEIHVTAVMLQGENIVSTEDEGPLLRRSRILVDNQPPKVRIEDDTSQAWEVYQGDPLEVRVSTSDDTSGVEKVEWDLNQDPAGQIKEPKLANPRDESHRVWDLLIPTAELKPGSYTFYVQATDRVPITSLPRKVRVHVKPPKPIPPASRLNKLLVSVIFNSKPVKDAKVTGPMGKVAKTDENGQCTFDKVPPGNYRIRAEGTIKGSIRNMKDPVDVTVEAPPAEPTSVTLTLEVPATDNNKKK